MDTGVPVKWLKNTKLVRWNTVLLRIIVSSIFLFFLLYFCLFIAALIPEWAKHTIWILKLLKSDTFIIGHTLVYNLIYISWNVLFFVWLTRILRNNKHLDPVKSVKWSVISWFIPVVQLYMPYRTMRHLFRSLDRTIDPENSDLRKKSARIVKQWWFVCILSWSLFFGILLADNLFGKSVYFWLSVGYLFKLIINCFFALSKIRMINYYNQLEEEVIARKEEQLLIRQDNLIDR